MPRPRWKQNATSYGTAADAEYQKTRRALDRKAVKSRKRGKRAPTRSGGERSSTPRSTASARPRRNLPPPAASSPRLFDTARERRQEASTTRPRPTPPLAFDSGQRKPPRSTPTRPSRSTTVPGWPTAIASAWRHSRPQYRKFKLNPEAPAPTRESYDRYSDPSDELFTRLARMEPPLKLLEGLIIPKAMKGGREAWVFIFVILPLVGLVWCMGLDDPMITVGAAVVGGAALAFALRTWLVKLSKSQLESRYFAAHALAGRCRWP